MASIGHILRPEVCPSISTHRSIAPKGFAGKVDIIDLPAAIVHGHQSVLAKKRAWPADLQAVLIRQKWLHFGIATTCFAGDTSERAVGKLPQPYHVVRIVVYQHSYSVQLTHHDAQTNEERHHQTPPKRRNKKAEH